MSPKINSAIRKAEKLARYAAKHDGHLSPIADTLNDDYGDFTQDHREEWEQTDHVQVLYIEQLCAISEAVVDRNKSWEAWYEFHTQIKDAFWDEWESKVKLFEFWEENGKLQHA